MGAPGRETMLRRFEASFEPEPNSGCFLWTASCDRDGYGYFAYGGETRAHRSAWVMARGPVPDGQQVLHKCDVRCCVNELHFFLGTSQDNTADRHQKQRDARGQRNGACTQPERLARGERNGKYTKPE